jgi:hypothetical protein
MPDEICGVGFMAQDLEQGSRAGDRIDLGELRNLSNLAPPSRRTFLWECVILAGAGVAAAVLPQFGKSPPPFNPEAAEAIVRNAAEASPTFVESKERVRQLLQEEKSVVSGKLPPFLRGVPDLLTREIYKKDRDGRDLVDDLYEAIDLNHDGKITVDEIKPIRDAFRDLDSGGIKEGAFIDRVTSSYNFSERARGWVTRNRPLLQALLQNRKAFGIELPPD